MTHIQTGLDLLANAANRHETPCQQGLAPWKVEGQNPGPPTQIFST